MKKSLLFSCLAISSLAISGILYAGNLPNTARTLTSGIGSGTTHGRIPATHPATKSRAPAYRNTHAADYTAYFRQGTSHQPALSGAYAGSRPDSFPGRGANHMNSTAAEHTAGKLPQFESFPPSHGGNPGTGIPSSTSAGIPSSVSPGIPATVAAGVPQSVSTGIPDGVSTGIPDGVSTGIPATTPPVSTGQPANIPALPVFPEAATSHRAEAATAGFAAAADGLARRGGGRP
jgi:hypothetical protein